jgi:hypothetical protein
MIKGGCEKQEHRKSVAQLYIITHNHRLRLTDSQPNFEFTIALYLLDGGSVKFW